MQVLQCKAFTSHRQHREPPNVANLVHGMVDPSSNFMAWLLQHEHFNADRPCAHNDTASCPIGWGVELGRFRVERVRCTIHSYISTPDVDQQVSWPSMHSPQKLSLTHTHTHTHTRTHTHTHTHFVHMYVTIAKCIL